MSERINELAIQCGGIWRGGYVDAPNGDSVYTDKKFVDGSELNVTQFAELIVKECSKQLYRARDRYDHTPGRELSAQAMELAAALIENHFGVES